MQICAHGLTRRPAQLALVRAAAARGAAVASAAAAADAVLLVAGGVAARALPAAAAVGALLPLAGRAETLARVRGHAVPERGAGRLRLPPGAPRAAHWLGAARRGWLRGAERAAVHAAVVEHTANPDLATQLCSGCRVARYCSLECHRSDWKAGHKLECAAYARFYTATAKLEAMAAQSTEPEGIILVAGRRFSTKARVASACLSFLGRV